MLLGDLLIDCFFFKIRLGLILDLSGVVEVLVRIAVNRRSVVMFYLIYCFILFGAFIR